MRDIDYKSVPSRCYSRRQLKMQRSRADSAEVVNENTNGVDCNPVAAVCERMETLYIVPADSPVKLTWIDPADDCAAVSEIGTVCVTPLLVTFATSELTGATEDVKTMFRRDRVNGRYGGRSWR